MDKKIPKVYANNISSNIGNNEDVYYSNNDTREVKTPVKNINQKINEIFNSYDFIYKADVEIRLKDRTVNKRIVGKNATHLITIDNELIPITDIVDIERK